MKALLIVSTVIEAGAGLALLCCPSATAMLLLDEPLESPVDLTLARISAGAMLAIALACWCARDDTRNRAANGVVAAILLYDVAATAVLAYAGLGFGLQGLALYPAAALHATLAVWCAVILRLPGKREHVG